MKPLQGLGLERRLGLQAGGDDQGRTEQHDLAQGTAALELSGVTGKAPEHSAAGIKRLTPIQTDRFNALERVEITKTKVHQNQEQNRHKHRRNHHARATGGPLAGVRWVGRDLGLIYRGQIAGFHNSQAMIQDLCQGIPERELKVGPKVNR
jgi:hypothetical protein